MLSNIGKRLVLSVFVLWGLTVVTFVLSHVVPGNPALLILGSHATPSAIRTVEKEYGLTGSLVSQYWHYIAALLHGNLGYSFVAHRSVNSALGTYLPASIELGLFALVVGTIPGIILGVMTAHHRGKGLDYAGRVTAGIGLSVPVFWLGLLAEFVFYYKLGWLPSGGQLSPGVAAPPAVTHMELVDALLAGKWSIFVDALQHIILPGLTLAASNAGMTARIVRTSMIDVLSEDYLRTAASKGLHPLRVLSRYSLRNALLPLVTIFGLEFAGLAGGVFLVENIFAWPGIGRFAVQAIQGEDYNSIMGITLVVAAFYVVTNLIVDVTYIFLDPRIRSQ